MELYHKEKLMLEKKMQLEEISKYLHGESQKQEVHEIEEAIFKKMMEIGGALLKEAIAIKNSSYKKTEQNQKKEEIKLHSERTFYYQSIFGKLLIDANYYWEYKKEPIFPLSRDLNFPENNQSYLLSKWIQRGLVEQSYDKTLGSIHEILGIKIARRIPEKLNKKISKEVCKYYKEKAPFLEEEGSIIIATADCKGVAMIPKERPTQLKEATRRGKGQKKKGLRKDSVVTSDYSINPIPRSPEDIIEGLMNVNSQKSPKENKDKNKKKNPPINKRVVATMFGKEKAFQDLADRIEARDIEEKSDIFLLIDGERALEKGLLSEFKSRKWKNRIVGICLDIIHVTEYLWEFGAALYGEKSCKRPVWVKKQLLSILNSKAGYVIGAMKQILTKNKKLSISKRQRMEKVIKYFENHKHMMNYRKHLKKGLPIASGVIEGACRSLVKDRMDGAGMKWSKEGANSILGLRSVKQNGYWDHYWEHYIQTEKERLYKEKNVK
jgi:hypothetical protein